jgi:hypothetical protein
MTPEEMKKRSKALREVLIPSATNEEKVLKKKLFEYEQELAHITRLQAEAERQPAISDHALLRYMERKMGFDIEALKGQLLTKERIAAINAGASKIKVDGVEFCIRNKVITTVV